MQVDPRKFDDANFIVEYTSDCGNENDFQRKLIMDNVTANSLKMVLTLSKEIRSMRAQSGLEGAKAENESLNQQRESQLEIQEAEKAQQEEAARNKKELDVQMNKSSSVNTDRVGTSGTDASNQPFGGSDFK